MDITNKPTHIIFEGYAGSHAYGTNTPTSDVDTRGLFVTDEVNLRTPFVNSYAAEWTDPSKEDTKFYELNKFMKLYLDCNPNIVELLWIDDNSVIQDSTAYRELQAVRHKLLSSRVAYTFSGYAASQLKRIKGHFKWISNPQPKEAPRHMEFVSLVRWFGQEKMLRFDPNIWNINHRFVPFGSDLYGVYPANGYTLFNSIGQMNNVFEGEQSDFNIPLMIVRFNKADYKTAKEKHSNYWEWKRNRNKKRSALEEKFSFDTKHASHLVRLLRMGKEILTTGQVLVKRPDAAELLAIRNGAWTYEELIEYAEEMDHEITKVLYTTTDLPKKPNIKLARNTVIKIQNMVWNNG